MTAATSLGCDSYTEWLWYLYHGHVVSVPDKDFVHGFPSRAIDPGAVHKDDVFDGGGQGRDGGAAKEDEGGDRSC
jgi:hypothetical protein